MRHRERHEQVPATAARARVVQRVRLQQPLQRQHQRPQRGERLALALYPRHGVQPVYRAD
eukprot:14353-Pelagococcus_subviridis.AAC.1